MSTAALADTYRLIAELLLHPDDRDEARIAALSPALGSVAPPVRADIERFLADPGSGSSHEYVQTLELSPPCPLYLGVYLFEEPASCRGAATSGRNGYMIELTGLYRHFGFDLTGRDLPDYLPVMVDFLGITLQTESRDGIGLRRRLLEHYVQPGLEPLREALAKYESPYGLLVSALASCVEQDLQRMGDAPAWRPPADQSGRVASLPVLDDAARSPSDGRAFITDIEVRP